MFPRFMQKETVDNLDEGVKYIVEVLNLYGVETYESCDGSEGHSYLAPTVRFYGNKSEGYRAASIAINNGFPLKQLNRLWTCFDSELIGPDWEMVFWETVAYDAVAIEHIKESLQLNHIVQD